jgi:hypothetical protein
VIVSNAEKDLLAGCAAQLALVRAGRPGRYRGYLEGHFYDALFEGCYLAAEPDGERAWAEGAELDARVERSVDG